MFLNWTYNKIAFVIAKEIKTYWSYIVRICINLASNILLLESKKYFLTSQGLVGAGMNRRVLKWAFFSAISRREQVAFRRVMISVLY